ncbi:two-component system response regulator MtrA [soil metagenome]
MDALILLVEDDRSIREITRIGLSEAGFGVVTAGDGEAAIAEFRSRHPDLVVLDVMLPKRDGYEVLRAIRSLAATPVVMLTARSDTMDVVLGLELGADDYVTKPFEMPVLVARIRSALRRARTDAAVERLTLGPIEIDVSSHRVTGPDGEIELTPTEFRLLTELATSPGRVMTRELLLDRVWGYPDVGDSRIVDVAVQRLRSKVEADPAKPTLIETVRGFGYRAGS